ncbi:MAG: alpha/beta fold hydrolase [Ichthyobacteriaceae bacterium]|nr:alpha/beta fold hydrolase [Ichthyobacteriaceae bacterium]
MNLLHSKIYGSGQPIIILHGLFGMGDNWVSLAKRFANNFEVHVVDQRNHGRSFHDDSWTYTDMVDDLYNYIEHYNLLEIILLGHSMGGKTAMFFAGMYQNKLSNLIVVDIAPRQYSVIHQYILSALESIDFNVLKSRKEIDELLISSISDVGIRQFLLKSIYWKDKQTLAFRFNLKVINNLIINIGEGLPHNLFFNKPTLFLSGNNSNYITSADVDDIETHFPESEIIDVENAGHWLHAEQPEIFYQSVINFLECTD